MWVLIKWVHFFLSFIAIADLFARCKDWGTRIVLLLIIVLVPIVGPGLYLLVLRPKE